MRGRGFVVIALSLLSWGCGSSLLWERYQAERQLWSARRHMEKVRIQPRIATAAEYRKAVEAFEAIVRRFPASEWCRPERLSKPMAQDVAMVSGDAAISLGRIAERQGRWDDALRRYQEVETQFAPLAAIRLKALLAQAAAYSRAGSPDLAIPILLRVGTEFEMVDAHSGRPVIPVMDAPLRVAADWAKRGRAGAADSLLAATEPGYLEAIERRRGGEAAPELWMHLARLRAMRPNQLGPSLEALRAGLNEPRALALRPRLVMRLAETSLQGGRPDSALAYTRWAVREFPEPTRADAALFEGKVWEAAGMLDSAIAAYSRFLDEYPLSEDVGFRARFRRAFLLEQLGRWEQARSEYRALVARNPMHDLSMEALERIVAHHVGAGERDLAGLEGRRAIETLDRNLATSVDATVQLRSRASRARVLLAIREYSKACEALSELWASYPDQELGVQAALDAAQLAERELGDRARAERLYREVVARAPDAQSRESARRGLLRVAASAG